MYSTRNLHNAPTLAGSLPVGNGFDVKTVSFALASLRLMKDDLETQLRKVSAGKRNSRFPQRPMLCQMTSENNQFRAEAVQPSYGNRSLPSGLLSKSISAFEWQVLEKIIMVCLYHKKEMPMATLSQMLFEDARLELSFQLQFGSLSQFVKRHGRVFFIHRSSKNPQISLKIDFVRQLLLSRNGTQNSAAKPAAEEPSMLIDEKMEKEIVRVAIQILFSHSAPKCTIGKLGQILHRRLNNPRLPKMFKHTYGGLKKFFERQDAVFDIQKDHLYNPIVTLNKEFRTILEEQMASENRKPAEPTPAPKLIDQENRPSPKRQNNLMPPARPPLTTSTSENLMNLACQGPEDLHKVDKENVNPKPMTWAMKVNAAQKARKTEAEDNAWLDQLPRQLTPPLGPVRIGRQLSA